VSIEQADIPIGDEEDLIGNAVDLVHVDVIPELDVLLDQWDALDVDLSEEWELLDEGREHLLLQAVIGVPADLGFQLFTRHLLLLVLHQLDILLHKLDGFVGKLIVPGELFQ